MFHHPKHELHETTIISMRCEKYIHACNMYCVILQLLRTSATNKRQQHSRTTRKHYNETTFLEFCVAVTERQFRFNRRFFFSSTQGKMYANSHRVVPERAFNSTQQRNSASSFAFEKIYEYKNFISGSSLVAKGFVHSICYP